MWCRDCLPVHVLSIIPSGAKTLKKFFFTACQTFQKFECLSMEYDKHDASQVNIGNKVNSSIFQLDIL